MGVFPQEIEVQEYLDETGHSAWAQWFDDLDRHTARRVTIALDRMRRGNFSNVRSVGKGVLEYRIDFGPGYRVYFGREGNTLIILLGGGTKTRQQMDIRVAQERWERYRRLRGQGSQ